eukprot:5545570-Amphidinium_carterae.1
MDLDHVACTSTMQQARTSGSPERGYRREEFDASCDRAPAILLWCQGQLAFSQLAQPKRCATYVYPYGD